MKIKGCLLLLLIIVFCSSCNVNTAENHETANISVIPTMITEADNIDEGSSEKEYSAQLPEVSSGITPSVTESILKTDTEMSEQETELTPAIDAKEPELTPEIGVKEPEPTPEMDTKESETTPEMDMKEPEPTQKMDIKEPEPASKTDAKDSNSGSTVINSEKAEKNPEKEAAKALKLEEEKTLFNEKYLEKYNEQQAVYTAPIVNIYTDDGLPVVSRTEYKHCEIFTSNVEEENMLYCAPAQIRTRGNSTDYYGNEEKARTVPVPYRIKFDEKRSFLGLNNGAKCKNWVLLKVNWNLLTDEIAFSFGRNMFRNGNFCSDSRIVHVFVNDEDRGFYTACEQTQVNKHRINVFECPENYEGTDIGYLVEIDNYWEEPYFQMYYSKETVTDINGKTLPFRKNAYSIKSDIYSKAQKRFITEYITGTFDVLTRAILHDEYYVLNDNNQLVKADLEKLWAEDTYGCTTDAELVANQVLDMDSVVDTYLLHEIVMSYDIGEGSFFMCVDFSKDSTCKKLRFTAPWDFNWAFYENPEEYGCYAGTFWDDDLIKKYGERFHPWFILLMTQEWFRNRVCDRWEEIENTGILRQVLADEKQKTVSYRSDIECVEHLDIYYGSAIKLISNTEKRLSWMDETYIQNRCENIIKAPAEEEQISEETSEDPSADK